MLSIGWTEMMLVAAVALIVVGPKDLPGMLRQIGKAVGSVRRMGNDFKAELNKVTAVDELKDIKRSIAAPLTDVRRDIEKEFNSIAPSGEVIPSGKIAPSDPDAQSVADEIKAAAGIETPAPDGEAAKASIAKAVTTARDKTITAAEEAKAQVIKAPRKARGDVSTRAKNEAARKARVAAAESAKETTTKKPAARKATTRKTPAKKTAKSETK